MVLNVQAFQEEFNAACSYGYAHGWIRQSVEGKTIRYPVYVHLGQQRPSDQMRSRDGKTEFKFFVGCTVEVFEKEEDMDDSDNEPMFSESNVSVRLIGRSSK